jgi:hypothetical protein
MGLTASRRSVTWRVSLPPNIRFAWIAGSIAVYDVRRLTELSIDLEGFDALFHECHERLYQALPCAGVVFRDVIGFRINGQKPRVAVFEGALFFGGEGILKVE